MEITSSIVNLSDYGKQGNAAVHRLHVRITDADARIADMIRTIGDITWVSRLDVYAQTSYQAALDETVPMILAMLTSYSVDNGITKDIGEYIVSDSASESLHRSHSHVRLPLSELWKEKKSGNPGFDFHTISTQNHIVFGEAKYRTNSNPHTESLSQASRFFNERKHEKDVIHIKAIAGEVPANKLISGEFGCAVAFSVHGDNIDDIIDFALGCEHIDSLLNYKDVYIIGVDYDRIVFDTYDYIDKVIYLSLSDPLCAACSIYYDQRQDVRAKIMCNYLKYGTNDEKEIWLLKYGFTFEDMEWLNDLVVSVDER